MADKEPIARSPRGRVARVPVGQRDILTVKNKDPDYVYRVVNDQGDRIEAFKDAGYEVVDAKSVRVGDKRVNQPTPEGSAATVSVGKGEKAVVMRIHKDLYEEDQMLKREHVRKLEDSIKNPSGDGNYGNVSIQHMK